jgi:hypothetical protein
MSFHLFVILANCLNLQRVPQWQRERQPFSQLIVGGVPASIREFPHHLALVSYDQFICGASVISFQWALTGE